MKTYIALAISTLTALPVIAAEPQPEEILVTAEFREQSVLDLNASASVLSEETIKRRVAANLEDLLNLAPNVNFSQGASRGRFVQIRGIGRRSEFTNPASYSVGILVDGIDFSTIGAGVSTLDVQQVEILRGPQGTLYGANALAGLINVVSTRPEENWGGEVSTTLGNYDTHGLSAIVNAPVTDSLGMRLAVQQFDTDGYVDNIHLGRVDTNNIDEFSSKAVIAYSPASDFSIDTTIIYVKTDNGYDTFSLDNTRQTYSDEPGKDTQETLAFSSRIAIEFNENHQLQTTVSASESNLVYSYDEDWSYNGLCTDFGCDPSFEYSSFDNYRRGNSNRTLDVRLLSEYSDKLSGVVGIYLRDQDINLKRSYTFDSPFYNEFNTENSAIFGELSYAITDATEINGGLRFERFSAEYDDNRGVGFSPDDNLWAARIAISHALNDSTKAYVLAARGYANGGFNIDGTLPAELREYDAEDQWNYEIGIKGQSSDQRFSYSASLFLQERNDIQTSQSFVTSNDSGEIGGDCPCSFTDYTDNAPEARSSGLEVELRYNIVDPVTVWASLGLLDAKFTDFKSFSHVNANSETGEAYNMKGREVAHAPRQQATLGASYQVSDSVNIQVDIENKDSFYFSDRHEERSSNYTLINARIDYQIDDIELSLWGKNLGDKDYETRGFGSFGNDPRKGYITEPYYQYAAPLTFGASATYQF